MLPLSMLPRAAQKAVQLLPASPALNPFIPPALDRTSEFNPTLTLLLLYSRALLALLLATYPFSWDRQNSMWEHTPVALAVIGPALIGMLLS